MTNNDIFKKLRVALMLRDDQIVDILGLVDFRITKSELGAFFRAEDHPNYTNCGDQVLRNFLNGLVIYLRGTKEAPKNPMDVLGAHKAEISKKEGTTKPKSEFKPKPKTEFKPKPKTDFKKPASGANAKGKKQDAKAPIVEKFQYKSGKNKKS